MVHAYMALQVIRSRVSVAGCRNRGSACARACSTTTTAGVLLEWGAKRAHVAWGVVHEAVA